MVGNFKFEIEPYIVEHFVSPYFIHVCTDDCLISLAGGVFPHSSGPPCPCVLSAAFLLLA